MENINEKKLLNILENLLLTYSPSKNEIKVSEYIINFFKNLNAEIYLDESFEKYGGNCPTIFVKIKGNVSEKAVTFSAHLDVVEPNKNLKIIKDGNIWKTDGRTTLGGDDKAGVAAIMYVIKYIVENKKDYPDIYAIFTPAEELGMLGARHIDWQKVYKIINPAKNLIVLDNAGRAEYIAYKAPASFHYKIEIFGKSSHAGIEPEKGISSIKVLSNIISKIETGRIDQFTTSNVSKIFSDFPTNVVPDYAYGIGEIRSHSEVKLMEIIKSYKNIIKIISKKNKTEFKFTYEEDYPSLDSKDNLVFAKEFQKIYKKMGIDSKLQIIGGGSDANFFAKEGFNSIILSVGMQKVHTKEEYLEIDQLILTVKAIIKYLS